MARILVIDDEEIVRFTLRAALEQAGHQVFEADNGIQGLECQARENCDLAIIDIVMPAKGGLSTITEMRRNDKVVKIIAISGGNRLDGHDYLGRASDLGANWKLAKPFTNAELLTAITLCLEGHATPTVTNPEEAYRRFVPTEFLNMIGIQDITHAKLGEHVERKVTVLFCDIRRFTTISERMSPAESFAFINAYFSELVPVIHENGGLVDKFIGDAIMAIFCENADNAILASLAMLKTVKTMNTKVNTSEPLAIGIGLNTGMVVMGIVGSKDRLESTVIGDAVNLSSRLESLTKSYEVELLISESTLVSLQDASRYDIRFVDRLRVKGKHRPQSVYEVFDNDPGALRQSKRSTLENFEKAVAYYHLKEIDKAEDLFRGCLEANDGDTVAHLYLERCADFKATGHHLGTGELNQPVQWNAAYTVGIPEIDAQHQELLATINQLSQVVRDGQTERLKDVLDFLGSYTQNHFRTEEDLMRKYDYPFIEDHMHEHRRFIETYLSLRADIESARHDALFLLFKIDMFLVDWLIHHTIKVDKHMGAYILRKGGQP